MPYNCGDMGDVMLSSCRHGHVAAQQQSIMKLQHSQQALHQLEATQAALQMLTCQAGITSAIGNTDSLSKAGMLSKSQM